MRSVVFLDLGDGPVVCVGVVAQAGVVQRCNDSTIVGGEISLGRSGNLLAAGSGSVADNLNSVSNRDGISRLSGSHVGDRSSPLLWIDHNRCNLLILVLLSYVRIFFQQCGSQLLCGLATVFPAFPFTSRAINGERLNPLIAININVQGLDGVHCRILGIGAVSKRREGHCSDQHDCYQQQAEQLFAKCLHFVFLLIDWNK